MKSTYPRLKVFLCHGSEDKTPVRELCQRLIRDGVEPWLDEKDILPGQDWNKEIQNAVRSCDVVLVCLSKSTIKKSGFLQKEIKFALDVAEEKPEGTIFLIPVKLEEIQIPERLRHWQWVSLFEDKGYKRLQHALKERARELGLNFTTASFNARRFFVPGIEASAEAERQYQDRKEFLRNQEYPCRFR